MIVTEIQQEIATVLDLSANTVRSSVTSWTRWHHKTAELLYIDSQRVVNLREPGRFLFALQDGSRV